MKPKYFKKQLKQFIHISLLAASVCGAKAMAGSGGGNGGDAVVCPDGVYMLDSVESIRRGHPLSLETTELSYSAKIKLLIDRVKVKDENLAERLATYAYELAEDIQRYEETGIENQKNILFISGDLVNVADEGATFVPAGCNIEQLIIQNTKPLPGDKKFLFQKNLWNKMSLDEKTVAIFHEALYRDLLSQGLNSSPSTRHYNGLVVSGEVESMSDKTYFERLLLLEFPVDFPVRRDGIEFKNFTGHFEKMNLDFNENGDLVKVRRALYKSFPEDGDFKIHNLDYEGHIGDVKFSNNKWTSFQAQLDGDPYFNQESFKKIKVLETRDSINSNPLRIFDKAERESTIAFFPYFADEVTIHKTDGDFLIKDGFSAKFHLSLPSFTYKVTKSTQRRVNFELDKNMKIISIK